MANEASLLTTNEILLQWFMLLISDLRCAIRDSGLKSHGAYE